MKRRWRRLTGPDYLDECWQYEEHDPDHKPRKDSFADEVPGWRPLMALWQWSLSGKRQWRTRPYHTDGTMDPVHPKLPKDIRDYVSREMAMRMVERRLSSVPTK